MFQSTTKFQRLCSQVGFKEDFFNLEPSTGCSVELTRPALALALHPIIQENVRFDVAISQYFSIICILIKFSVVAVLVTLPYRLPRWHL